MSLRARPLTTLTTTFALVLTALVTVVALSSPAAAEGTVTVNVTGQGSVTGDGINCNQFGGDCSEPYFDECTDPPQPVCIPPGIELTAAGSPGFELDHFNGCTSTSGTVCSVTVTSPKSVTVVFRDSAPPAVSLTSPGSGPVGGAVNLAALSSDNVGIDRVEFRVRGVTVATDTTAPYSGSFDTTSIADGPASVTATAVDTSGNSATSSTFNINIDNTAPDTSITGGPADGSTIASTSASFTFFATEAGSTFQCRLDGAAFGSCPAGYAGLANGTHRFEVRAVDAIGNTDASPAARDFTVDTVSPDTSITGGPADGSTIASTSASFTFFATEAGSTFQCRLDGAAFGSCPTGYAGLADGPHRFEVRAVDAIGNIDASPAARSFTVDATAPVATFTKQPPRKVKTKRKKAKVTFAFAAEPGATFRCSLDAAAFAACPASVSYKVKPGRHTFRVVAVDAVGNVQAPPTTATFKVKRVATR